MKTIIIITILITAILILFATYFLIRNVEVCNFRNKVNDLVYRYGIRELDAHAYIKYYSLLPHYDKMLYSFKKLRLESYFTEQQISKLKGEA